MSGAFVPDSLGAGFFAGADPEAIPGNENIAGNLTVDGTSLLTGAVTASSTLGVTGRTTTAGVTNSGTLIESGVQTPSALAAGETLLWSPTAARHIRVAGTTSSFVCSMLAGTAGERRTIENVGTVIVAFGHQETANIAGSATTATDRFLCPDSVPYLLYPGASVDVWYDPTSTRWRVLAPTQLKRDRLAHLTKTEMDAMLGITLTEWWPCDDTSGVAGGSSNHSLTPLSTPVYDRRVGDYRGLYMDSSSDGFGAAADGDRLGLTTNSGIFFGWFAVDATNATDRGAWGSYQPVVGGFHLAQIQDTGAGGQANTFDAQTFDGTHGPFFCNTGKVVTDGVQRVGIYQVDKAAARLRTRVCGKGETAAAGTPTDISTQGSLGGGTSPFSFLGGTNGVLFAGTNVWLGGVGAIIGATAAGSGLLQVISHRMGAE